MSSFAQRLAARADQLYEFDREPVAEHAWKSGRYFAGLFAGEHVAATEFVIGAFFVLHGVTLADLVVGLLIGNLLAVLSWTFVCAPIATSTRLTLYWYLREIAGTRLTAVYNVLNAVLYCILAGAMIAVAATAVGLGFGLKTPALNDVLPGSITWVCVALGVGGVITFVAILGFERLSRFAGICAPWIFVVFIAGALASLPRLGVERDLSNLLEVAQTSIWNGIPTEGQEKFSVWHVLFFAWFANLAMHIGLSDMALFRYARTWKYGWYSALGMYTGHFLAWICSGVMVAAIGREMNPGLMAFEAVGLAGAIAVFVAGWTTANPTLYRAGLALQSVTPNWPRWKVTLAAGVATSLLACFPVVFLKLLDYVALYGLILMPIGAIVLVEHWILPRLGIARRGVNVVQWPAGVAWATTLVFCYLLPVHLYFLWLPGYVFAVVLYVGLKIAVHRRYSARMS